MNIVPELVNKPFKKLQHLVFEGESLSLQLGSFLFKSAVKYLETINIAVEEYSPEFKGKLSMGIENEILISYQINYIIEYR